MSYELPIDGGTSSETAAADLSAKQFHAVKLASGGVDLCGAADADAYGILADKPTSGTVGQVVRHGIAKAILGDTVARGDRLTTDSAGKLVTGTAAQPCVAIALAAGTANAIVPVEVVATAGGLCISVDAADAPLRADLASTAANKGATLIGVRDAGNKFTATNVETVLLEVDGRIAAAEAVLGEQGAAVADVANVDAVAAAGAAPDAAEFLKTVNLCNELKTQFNLLAARVRAHGLIAT